MTAARATAINRPMCGVAGVLQFDGQRPSLEQLRRMSSALAHRGPDGVGHETFGACGLAHRRLSIIDLSEAGHQPMPTDDGALWLIHNGEVYNYLELREELEKLGHRFRSQTDTEVILLAYRQWGTDCFRRFNGMWGLALWDDKEQRLVLSRDRLGIKPLYLYDDGKRLLFASEVKAILAADPSLAVVNRRNVARHLARASLCFVKESFFEGIDALEPGSFAVFTPSGRRHHEEFWTFTPPLRTTPMPAEEAREEVKALLTDSVRLRFRSDVPVGTCLSGGIDSSSIVSLAHHALGRTPKSFSAVYDEARYDETRFVRLMVERMNLDAFEVSPDGRDLGDVLERATYHQDGPTPGPGVYTQWHVMQMASKEVTVLLDGQGGDELFAGYFHNFVPYVRSLVSRVRRGDAGALRWLWRVYAEVEPLTGKNPVKELAQLAWKKRRDRYRLSIRRRPPVTDHIYTPELMQAVASEVPSWVAPRVTGDALTDTLWNEIARASLPGLLHFEDRDSMAFSIEARTPFLDHRLVEYSFQIPAEHKIVGSKTKAILRDAMSGVLPDEIRDRKDKMGYPTPFSTWIRTHQLDWLKDLILSERAVVRGFTNRPAVENMIADHVVRRADHGAELYALATLEIYCRRFLDRPFEAEAPPARAVMEDRPATRTA